MCSGGPGGRERGDGRAVGQVERRDEDVAADVGGGLVAGVGVAAAMVTSAPASASARAVSIPMPEAPPVTTARRPVRSTPARTSDAVVSQLNGQAEVLAVGVLAVIASLPVRVSRYDVSGGASALLQTNRRILRLPRV